MMKKRLVSSSLITRIFSISMAVIVMLLITLNVSIILNEHRAAREKEENALRLEIGYIEEALAQIESFTREIRYYDTDFPQIARYSEKKNLLRYRVDLMERIDNALSLNARMSGFFIRYTGVEEWVYRVNLEHLPSFVIGEMKEKLPLTKNAEKSGWTLMKLYDRDVLCMNFTSGNADFYAVYSMKEAEELLKAELGKDTEVFLYSADTSDEQVRRQVSAWELDAPEARIVRRDPDLRTHIMAAQIENAACTLFTVEHTSPFNMIRFSHWILIVVSLVFVIFIGLVGHIMQRIFTRPLADLNNIMEQIRTDPEYEIPERRYVLADFDNTYQTLQGTMTAVKEQKLRVYEEELEHREAELRYLQLQIQPHFYINSLKTIQALSSPEDQEQLRDYIQRLSEHLRYLMSIDRRTVPLSNELSFTENYVRLQRMMTGRHMDYSVVSDFAGTETDPDVPFLLVQTFVENSIKYARLGSPFARLRMEAEIRLLKTEEETYIDFTFRDNGQGYPDETLAILNSAEPEKVGGIGLTNIIRSLRMLYGEKAEFVFENDEGTFSECIFPARVADTKPGEE